MKQASQNCAASRLTLVLIVTVSLLAASCSSSKKKAVLELSALQGKKVALVGVEAEPTARKIIEVALVNQLLQHGSFQLISKQDVDQAARAPEQDPTDWRGIAKRAGAEYALQADVDKFNADIQEGYSSEVVYDSQLAQEQGTDGKTNRVYKVKELTAEIQVTLKFTDLKTNQTVVGVASAKQSVQDSQKSGSIRLPPPLRFLEKLANQGFQKFFEQYR